MRDASAVEEVKKRIPQREPFLFVDEILEQVENKIITSYYVRGDEDFFQGHFPSKPILPGVIIQEALFQSGSLLMSFLIEGLDGKIGVVTRVSNAKFRQIVSPGQKMVMHVEHTENLSNAYFFKSKAMIDNRTVAAVDFCCSLA